MWVALLLVGAVALIVGIAVWQKKRVTEASVPQRMRFSDGNAAQGAVDSVAVRVGLDRTGWSQSGDDWVQALYPSQTGRNPFRVNVTVTSSGSARIALVSEGASQEMLLGFIPMGPVMPHGTDPFLRFAKLLKESAGTSSRFLGHAQWSPSVPVGVPVSYRAESPPQQSPSDEDIADISRDVLELLHGVDGLEFEHLDVELDAELLTTLTALRRLVARGDIVREPGGVYRILPTQGNRA